MSEPSTPSAERSAATARKPAPGIGATIGLAAVLLLTAASGLIHGRLTDRWGVSADVVAAAEKLLRLPDRLGDWELKHSEELGEGVAKQLQASGAVVRTYQNLRTGETVNVVIILGASGPLSVHPPEVCFAGANFQQLSAAEVTDVKDSSGRAHRFRTVRFLTSGVEAVKVRVYYAWNTGSGWTVPDNPRLTLARYPYAYKLELMATVIETVEGSTDAGTAFLEQCLPLIDPYLEELPGSRA